MTLLMTKLSQKTRELFIYCPYLIMNETDQKLVYREHGLTKDIISMEISSREKLSKKKN
jgi:hypothetical protein